MEHTGAWCRCHGHGNAIGGPDSRVFRHSDPGFRLTTRFCACLQNLLWPGLWLTVLINKLLMLDLVLLPFVFWLGLAGLIMCTCFIVCSLIWLLHRDPGQVVVASTCGGTTWSATVGWAYSCAAASGRSRASRRLNEPPILGLAPTGCQARGGRCHEVRVLLGAGGHCGKIDSAKLSVNKQYYIPW